MSNKAQTQTKALGWGLHLRAEGRGPTERQQCSGNLSAALDGSYGLPGTLSLGVVCMCACACLCAQGETQLREDREALGKSGLARMGMLCQPCLVRGWWWGENLSSEVLTAPASVPHEWGWRRIWNMAGKREALVPSCWGLWVRGSVAVL